MQAVNDGCLILTHFEITGIFLQIASADWSGDVLIRRLLLIILFQGCEISDTAEVQHLKIPAPTAGNRDGENLNRAFLDFHSIRFCRSNTPIKMLRHFLAENGAEPDHGLIDQSGTSFPHFIKLRFVLFPFFLRFLIFPGGCEANHHAPSLRSVVIDMLDHAFGQPTEFIKKLGFGFINFLTLRNRDVLHSLNDVETSSRGPPARGKVRIGTIVVFVPELPRRVSGKHLGNHIEIPVVQFTDLG